ncbi:MAG: alpha/beta hydrolase [Chitinophagaceae bacterium]
MTLQTIYCLSGLGADEKIFRNLRLDGYELKHIAWLRPKKKETIQAYAARMAEAIPEDNPIVIGVSFGGMMAIEIARQRPLRKLILISSIKSKDELPRWMRMTGRLRLNRFLPVSSNRLTERFDNDRLGVSNEEEKQMVQDYRRSADKVYQEWAINEIVNWKNEWIPDCLVHIHGEFDKMFPLKRITADHVIKGATHFMVYNSAAAVSECINKVLAEEKSGKNQPAP